jgi:hypothetical protein
VQLQPGQIVHVRSRQYLVEQVIEPRPDTLDSTLVHLSCIEDDAQGEPLAVLWEREVDARVIGASSWDAIAQRGFDAPRLFSAYGRRVARSRHSQGQAPALPQRDKDDALRLLEDALASPRLHDVPDVTRARLSAGAPRDVAELVSHLEKRAQAVAERAERLLARRGEQEAADTGPT